MSSDWEEISIDDLKAGKNNAIAMGPFGSRIKKENFTNSGIPVIKGGNLNGDFILEDDFDYLTIDKADELSTSNAFRRDIVITHRGTIGQVGIIPDNSKHERYVVSQSQLKVSLDESRVNPYFVYYFLRSPIGQHRLLSNASQVGVPAIAQASTSVKSILVPVPKIEVQDKIVEILLSLDHKIEANKQTNETLEAMAQAIFKSWFVDFDPVRAKIEANKAGRDPNRAVMAAIAGVASFAEASEDRQDWDEIEAALDQKLSNMSEEQRQQLNLTAQLFPDELVESEIGEVPKGWGLLTLEDYITLSYGKSLRKKDRKDGSIPVYGSGGLTGTHDESLIDGPGIIVGRKGTVGSIYWEDKDSWPIDTVFYVEPKNEVDLSFYYYLLNTLGLDDMNTDAAVPGLNRNNAYRLKIPSFPADLMKSFANFTSDIHSMVFSKKEETKTLENLRDTLLPRLISGGGWGVKFVR
jgi:type I restriction enzyme, S subunit